MRVNTRDLDGLRGVLQSLVDNAKTPYETANTARVEALKLKGEAEEALNTATSDRNNVKDRIFATWQDRRCHRSLASGQAQAARQIEDDDPRTSVTFIHLACSGAKIEEGLLEGYRGIRPTRKEEKDKALLDAQVDEFKETVGDREVDAVLISIGGNDVGFADIITRCMFAEKCYEKPFILQNVPLAMAYANCVETRQWSYEYDCNSILETEFGPRENVEELFQTGKRGLPGGYRKLNEKLLEVNELDPHRVYISEYPNATRDGNGTTCRLKKGFFGISQPEWEWAEGMTKSLNEEVKQAADDHNWTFVSGIFDGFKEHGFCAKDSWLVRLGESLLTEGRKDGTMHPNQQGYGSYKDAILASVEKDFYPDGDVSSPRPPR